MWLRTQFRRFVNLDDSSSLPIEKQGEGCVVIRNVSRDKTDDVVIWAEHFEYEPNPKTSKVNKHFDIAILKCEYILDYISDHLIRNEKVCNLKQIDFCLESSVSYKELQDISNKISIK